MIFKQIAFAWLLILSVVQASAQDFPAKAQTLVSDFTGTLSSEQSSALERKLVAFDDSSSNQVAVVLIRSVGDYDISQYASELAERWGVGRGGKDNGIILLAALNDRKVTIQTGYGLEGAIPDAIAKRIIENEIKPAFRSGDYYTGLDRATDAIIAYTKGEYKNEDPRKKPSGRGGGFPVALIVIIILVFLISRGGGGRGGQIIGGRGGASPFWWFLLGSGLGRGSRGGGGGWGGFSGGGGGGGFGGFGGGRFGGGGASGSW
jgi:uncharacterized protein